MSATAFKFRMPAGIPGDVTRKEVATIEPNVIDDSSSHAFSALLVYGNPVKMVSGKIRPIPSGASASDIYGILVRPFPTNATQDALGTSVPPLDGECDVLKRGYISVKLAHGTSAKNGPVYVRVDTGGAGGTIGQIQADSDTSHTVLMAGAYFMGVADESGNVEIAFNI